MSATYFPDIRLFKPDNDKDPMDKVMTFVIICGLILLACLLGSCSTQHGLINLNVVLLAKKPVAKTNVSAIVVKNEKYLVHKSDCLWSISKTVYSDPFSWPILWKANRDIIKNPDLIYVGQILKVRRSNDDLKLVHDFASQWPRYKKP